MSEPIKIKQWVLGILFALVIHLAGVAYMIGTMAQKINSVFNEVEKRTTWVYSIKSLQMDLDKLEGRVLHLERTTRQSNFSSKIERGK